MNYSYDPFCSYNGECYELPIGTEELYGKRASGGWSRSIWDENYILRGSQAGYDSTKKPLDQWEDGLDYEKEIAPTYTKKKKKPKSVVSKHNKLSATRKVSGAL